MDHADTFGERLKAYSHSAIAAFQFLTRFPLPVTIRYTEDVIRRSVLFYPAAGLAIGLVLAAAAGLFAWLFPPFPAAVIVLSLWVFLTGALHLDGVMDTADGIFSYRSREQMLVIMKDSRVGAMGVIAGVLCLLLKLSLIHALLESHWSSSAVFLAVIPACSRGLLAAAIAGWPYVRSEGGMGASLQGVTAKHAWAAGTAAFVLAFATFMIWGVPLSAALRNTILVLGAAGVCVWAGSAYFHSRLGGLTGDTYGAINEGAEVVQLAAALILFEWLEPF